jgi:hypothetical protein
MLTAVMPGQLAARRQDVLPAARREHKVATAGELDRGGFADT